MGNVRHRISVGKFVVCLGERPERVSKRIGPYREVASCRYSDKMRIAEPHVIYDQALIGQLQVKRRLYVPVQAFLRPGEPFDYAFRIVGFVLPVGSEQLPVEAYAIVVSVVGERLFRVFEPVRDEELVYVYEQSPVVVFAEFADEVIVCGNLLAHSRKVNEMDIVWHFFFETPVVLIDVYVVKADIMVVREPLAQVMVFVASYCN